MLGALIIAVLRNGFSLLSVSSAVQNLVFGLDYHRRRTARRYS